MADDTQKLLCRWTCTYKILHSLISLGSFSNDVLQLDWLPEASVTFSEDFRTFAVKVTQTETSSCTEQLSGCKYKLYEKR